jgi:hypothetical protein
MKKGDILLIKSRFDPVGWLIRKFTHCQWNHVAWALNENTLIELKAKGKRITPLKKYLNNFLYKCKLVRIKDLDNCKVDKAIERASQTVFNYPYSSAILNFILIKFKILKKFPRLKFPRLSCSGFVAYYLKSEANFKFNNKNTFFITPKDIDTSKKVKNVSQELN